MSTSILQEFRCALTKHSVSQDALKQLLSEDTVSTKCVRCGTPLELIHNTKTDKYYLTEKRINNPETKE